MHNATALIGLLLGLAAPAAASAATVYTWTDAQGVRHFSQYPPADSAQPSETLTLESPAPTPASADRLQNIRDVARDLEDARLRREEQRAKPAPPPASVPPPVEQNEPPYLVVPYPAYPYGAPYPPPYPYPPSHRPGPHKPKHGLPDEPGGEPDTSPPKSGARVLP